MMLEPILAATHRRIDALDGASVRVAARGVGPVRDLAAALGGRQLAVIAEIKRRSPSAGPIAPGLDPAKQAMAYAAGGAAAISVLTEPEFFDGSLDDLRKVREVVDVPVLRKDFILDPAQIWEARAAGADAVLLIVAALTPARLAELAEVAADAGLAALVETHTVEEAGIATAAGASIIGVNNRDLATFSIDLAVAEIVAPTLPRDAIRVAESGVSTPEGAARMRRAGYDAVLVGEALVRADDPVRLLADLRAAT
jgi:indole-3-glycerol phosphate synthase